MSVQSFEAFSVATLQEWLDLPEGPPFFEWEAGRLVVIPSPKKIHQKIVGLLFHALYDYVARNDLGVVVMELDVALPNGVGYYPDLAFIAKDRLLHLMGEDNKIHGALDMVVEVVSPFTQSRDRVIKFQNYYEAGVSWYWLIDSETLAIQEFEHSPEGYVCRATISSGALFEPKLFPNLKINLPMILGVQPER